MWCGRCIIRSIFLGKIKEAFDQNPELTNLLLNPFFRDTLARCESSLRRIVIVAAQSGVPVSVFAALSCFDGYTCERLPANLQQAQSDYFGLHTYELIP